MSIPKIKTVTNSIWTRKDKVISDLDVDLNQIIVTFDVDRKLPLRIRVNRVELKNDLGDILPYNDGNKNETLHGLINVPELYLCFNLDECLLSDGATFTIVMQDIPTGRNEKHEFLLSQGEWIEKDGGSAPCPA